MTRLTTQIIAAGAILSSVLFHSQAMAQDKSNNRAVYTSKMGATITSETALPDGRLVYKTVKQMPEFQGDISAFLLSNLRYPEEARKKSITGRSVVRFIVSSDGKVSDAEIARSAGNELLDNEALRVVNLMQDWKPGVHEGQPVAVYYILPITYKLD